MALELELGTLRQQPILARSAEPIPVELPPKRSEFELPTDRGETSPQIASAEIPALSYRNGSYHRLPAN
jgi:hypothetical protein